MFTFYTPTKSYKKFAYDFLVMYVYLRCWDLIILYICNYFDHIFLDKKWLECVGFNSVKVQEEGWIDLLKLSRKFKFYHSTQKINQFIWQWTNLFWHCLCFKSDYTSHEILEVMQINLQTTHTDFKEKTMNNKNSDLQFLSEW